MGLLFFFGKRAMPKPREPKSFAQLSTSFTMCSPAARAQKSSSSF
jgi:hypothetical protein